MGNFDMEFEPTVPMEIPFDDHLIVSGLSLSAGVMDTPTDRHPALVFRFMGVEGNFLTPITLVVDSKSMHSIAKLMWKSIQYSIQASRQPKGK